MPPSRHGRRHFYTLGHGRSLALVVRLVVTVITAARETSASSQRSWPVRPSRLRGPPGPRPPPASRPVVFASGEFVEAESLAAAERQISLLGRLARDPPVQ